VDFAARAAEIDEAALRPGRERGGRPPFPTEMMVRVLVVQQLYNLRDEQMECQLLDRLSFKRFVGLRQCSQAPDRTTIWTFKEQLIKVGASQRIFDAVSRQFGKRLTRAVQNRLDRVSEIRQAMSPSASGISSMLALWCAAA